MSIDLRIDTISIAGLPLQTADAERMRQTIAERLVVLIETGGIDPTSNTRDRVSGDMPLPDTRPATVANEIAGAIYSQIGDRQ